MLNFPQVFFLFHVHLDLFTEFLHKISKIIHPCRYSLSQNGGDLHSERRTWSNNSAGFFVSYQVAHNSLDLVGK